MKTSMTHLSQSGRKPQQYTLIPKIGDEIHNNPWHSFCKTHQLQNSFRACCLLNEEMLGPNVWCVNLMMEGFGGPIHCHEHKGHGDHLQSIMWSPNVLCDPQLRPALKIIIPLELPTCPSSSQVATRHSRDLKQQCQHLSDCWTAVKRARRWPDNNQGPETIPSQAWVKNKIQSCVIDSDHS